MRKNIAFLICIMIGFVLAFFFSYSGLLSKKEEKVMAGYAALLAKEDLTVAEVIAYVDQHIDEVAAENAGKLVLGLEWIQQEKLPAWQRRYDDSALQAKMAQVYQRNWALEDFKTAEDEEVRYLVAATIKNGYKVETAEGQFFPVLDYTFYRKYFEAISADLTAYFELMAVESEVTPVKDGALMISWEEVLQRAKRQEQFIDGYSGSTQVEPVRALLKRYVTFAYSVATIPRYLLIRRKKWTKQNWLIIYLLPKKQREFCRVDQEYLHVLAANDYRLTEEVDAYRQAAAAAW